MLLIKIIKISHNTWFSGADGIKWTARTSSGETNSWQSITWSPELEIFCAVAFAGADRVMTSVV